jgi:hypothetical protein
MTEDEAWSREDGGDASSETRREEIKTVGR